jgi:hypothetical protein
MPNLMAFPKKTSDGKDIVASGTTSLTLRAKFGGAASESSFTWSLPLQYPAFVSEAMQFVNKSRTKPVGEMSEEELLNAYLPSTMAADISTGFLTTIIPTELFKIMIEKDPAMLENDFMKEMAAGLINNRSFIALTSFDQKSERIAAAAKTATAIDSTGKTVALDVETYKTFLAGRKKEQESFEILIFPQLGATGKISLLFTDPDTGKEVRFDWNLKKEEGSK